MGGHGSDGVKQHVRRAVDAGARTTQLARLLATLVIALAAVAVEAVPAASGATGQDIVKAAAKMAGKPYCWAGGDERGPTRGKKPPGYASPPPDAVNGCGPK